MQKWHLSIIAALILSFCLTTAPVCAKEETTPQAVVEGFYSWYFATDGQYRQRISEQKERFEPELLELLVIGFKKQAPDKGWIDFDPFLNAQWDGKSAKVAKVHVTGNTSSVLVDLVLSRGQRHSVKIFLRKTDGRWKIANFIYDKDFDLLSFLRDIR